MSHSAPAAAAIDACGDHLRNCISWGPSGWPQLAPAPIGTGVLTVGCSGPFRAVRVGIPNAATSPFVITRIAVSASSSWNDYVNPTGGVGWRHLTFAGQGKPSDAVVCDTAAPVEITAWPSPAPALPGSGIAPRWTWTDWAPVRSAAPDPISGMHVVMFRWLNVTPGQTCTYANGTFGHGGTGLPQVHRGFDRAIGGFNNGSDCVTQPIPGDMQWELCRQNTPLSGTPLAIVQFLTENRGVVGMVVGDSHHSGTGTTSGLNNFLAQLTNRLDREHAPQLPFGYVNCAVRGVASQEMFAHLSALLPIVQPSFVVLPGWTYNEVQGGLHATQDANRLFLSYLVQAAYQVANYGSIPIILTPFPRNAGAMAGDVLDAWRDLRGRVISLRGNGFKVADAGAALSEVTVGELTGTYAQGLSDDTIHPNDAGHAKVAELLVPIVERLVGLTIKSGKTSRNLLHSLTASPKGVSPGGLYVSKHRGPMNTLLFCTSYAATQEKWDERWGRWLKAVLNSGLIADKVLIVDDGSPVLPKWPGVAIEPAEAPQPSEARTEIHHFADRRGQRVGNELFPGWYRSFAHAVLWGIKQGFDKIIHIESDAFLISDRAVRFFNETNQGWTALWCARHRWPESTLQIINRDRFGSCEAFFSNPYSAHLGEPYRAIETLIPCTSIQKNLIGDRYGEESDTVPFGADYVSQVRWGMGPDYYWWLTESGERQEMTGTKRNFASVIEKYGCSVAASMTHSGVDYREFLRLLNSRMVPRSYLEIGTHEGDSVAAVSCDAICIDPRFSVERNVLGARARTFFFQMTSDEFFAEHDPRTYLGEVDLGFLDGLHHFEALLKDFINYERHSHSGSVALLHDCLPLNTRMAGRVHQPGPESEPETTRPFWTGDVWKILPALQEARPDLTILLLDCPPTGLVLCAGLNHRSNDLVFRFDDIVRRYSQLKLEDYGLERLWNLFPMLSTRAIASDPRVFCEQLRFRI